MLEHVHIADPDQRPPFQNYSAFGLNIRSQVPFMDVADSAQGTDVDILLDVLPDHWLEDPRAAAGFVEVEGETIWFVWADLGVMRIHDGRQITLHPVPHAQRSLIHQAVQSAGLGLILHQRNMLTLHASAVAIDDVAVAFVGYKGAGKSTTAAALYGQGHALVTDDLLVLEPNESGEMIAYPGIPQLRLWPEAVTASLDEDPERLPKNSEASVKRLRDTPQQFARVPLPLKRIYVLDFHEDETAGISISPMVPRDACIEMIRHAYALHYLGNEGASATHLQQSGLLSQRVAIRKLLRPRALDALPALVAAIRADVAPVPAL